MNNYFATIGDVDKLFYNIVHHMGNVYDNTVAIVALFRFGDQSKIAFWKNLGYYFGSSVNEICYVPEDFEPFKGKF